MGYCTRYDGEIKVFSDEAKKLIQNIFLREDDEGEFVRELYDSKFNEKKGILTVDEDRKNYNEEMEDIFSLIAYFDKKAKGTIIAEGEDGEDKERFVISEGKVFREEGYLAYKNKKNITHKYKKDDLEEINEVIEKSKSNPTCERCLNSIDLKKFKFQTRGYYEEIKKEFGYEDLCQKCYIMLKAPIIERNKARLTLQSKEEAIQKEKKKK
jgi:hypothetical protein